MSDTILDRIVGCLDRAAASFDPNVAQAPVALLWPDEDARWQPIVDRIAERVPLISLGDFDPARRRGPAYWIRCVLAGTVDVGLVEGRPVVYLPGVPQGALRAVESCAPELAPIAELQYRSRWFANPKGRDWTVRALLSDAEQGLGITIADNPETIAALPLALDRLLDVRIDRLHQQVLDADYCHQLVNPDPASMILGWLDDPAGYRAGLPPLEWTAFVQQCKADYGLDPGRHGEIAAAGKLATRDGSWAQVWKRFAELPQRYPGVVEQLRKARPMEFHVDDRQSWPQDNENEEDHLRSRLADIAVLTAGASRKAVTSLDAEHAWRRRTVWADLGHAPLAFALEQLVVLAELTAQPLASSNLASLLADQAERGWRADDALLRALAAAPQGADRAAVSKAALAMYRPWAEAAATALQELVGATGSDYLATGPASAGAVTLFVDGLRLDIAHRVQGRLAALGLTADCATGLAALPTVTATAKAALVPAAAGVLAAGPELAPGRSSTGTAATHAVLKSLMAANKVQVLGSTEVGDPGGTAWTETGEIDHRGHDVGVRLVDHLDDEVDRVVARIRELLDAGWARVEVLTDHGWLLLPGGLEKVELPVSTTEVKKGRCARLKPGATVDLPTVAWFWDPDVRIAVAPGLSCFEAGKEYEHGGVSPQECIVPRLSVTAGASQAPASGPEITKVTWLGLLCRIELTDAGHGIRVDIRGLAADATTSIAERAKETTDTGKASLSVPDEDHEGQVAHLVLIDTDGQLLADREVIVGRNR